MTTLYNTQSDEELKIIYVAWRMGATIEHKNLNDVGCVWKEHTKYAEISDSGLIPQDYWIHSLVAGNDDERFTLKYDCDIIFRIKPNETTKES
jgi:hypothetical protein